MADEVLRDLERRALSDPFDDVAWRDWREALRLETNQREAAMRRVVHDAKRFEAAERRTLAIKNGLSVNVDCTVREKAILYFAASVHAGRARAFRRGLVRLKQLSGDGQRIGPAAITVALGLGPDEKEALKTAFEKALVASAESKKRNQTGHGAAKTVLQRVVDRGLNPDHVSLSAAGRRAAAAFRKRHEGRSPRHTEETAFGPRVMVRQVFGYEEDDMDLVDAAIDDSMIVPPITPTAP